MSIKKEGHPVSNFRMAPKTRGESQDKYTRYSAKKLAVNYAGSGMKERCG